MGVFMHKVIQQTFLLQKSKVSERELHLFFHICIFTQQTFSFLVDNLGLWRPWNCPSFSPHLWLRLWWSVLDWKLCAFYMQQIWILQKLSYRGEKQTHGRIQLVNFILGQYLECFIFSELDWGGLGFRAAPTWTVSQMGVCEGSFYCNRNALEPEYNSSIRQSTKILNAFCS